MVRYFCIVVESGKAIEMFRLALSEMDAIFDKTSLKNIIGYPKFFDDQERFWPVCCDGCVVAKVL